MSDALLDRMITAALEASVAIMEIYNTDFVSEDKTDGSPVTEADQRAEKIIIQSLADTNIPLLGEESVSAGTIPDLGDRYFVVDPVDGTKEFIKKNGQFTVNIALVEHGVPTLGVVMAPALNKMYTGSPSQAFEYELNGVNIVSKKLIQTTTDGPMTIVASRSHGHNALAPLCEKFGVTDDVSVGSSLKFCLVANGTARFYPRFTPTCEWDIAAGQAVLAGAGGAVVKLDGSAMEYGKRSQKFLNPFFVAAENQTLAENVANEMQVILNNLDC